MTNDPEYVQGAVYEKAARLAGIGGWLLVFVVGVVLGAVSNALLGLAFCVAGAFMTSDATTHSSWVALSVLCGVVLLALAGYAFYVFSLLTEKRSNAPRHAQRLLALAILQNIVFAVCGARGLLRESLVFDGGVGALGALGWLLYFRRSRRVANTYGQQQSETQSLNGNSI